MTEQEELVRKAVFVPPALWHRVKVDAVQQGIDISEIVVEALKQYYGLMNGNGHRAADGKNGVNAKTPEDLAAV